MIFGIVFYYAQLRKEQVMAKEMTTTKRYQVFVSSTFLDLQKERQAILQALIQNDYIPAGMEFFPAANESLPDFIKKVIDDSDYYIVLLGSRKGSIGKDKTPFTRMEYDYALKKGKPIIAFLDINPAPVKARAEDPYLRAFEALLRKKHAPGFWKTEAELIGSVHSSLRRAIDENPARGWVRGSCKLFKVQDFAVEITIEPLMDIAREVHYGGLFKDRKKFTTVTTGNLARFKRKVTFREDNDCDEFFCLSYRTKDEGIIVVNNSVEIQRLHEFTPLTRRLRTAYDDHGREILYHFKPKRGATNTLDINIYKGFEEGNQFLRVICPHPTRCDLFRFKVNLAAFIQPRYEISLAPQLSFYTAERDLPEHDGKPSLHTGCPSEGIWEWRIENKEIEGVYLEWKVNDRNKIILNERNT